jgi:hypothetical protein
MSVSLIDMMPVLVPFLAGTVVISSLIACSTKRTAVQAVQQLTERIHHIEIQVQQFVSRPPPSEHPAPVAYYYSTPHAAPMSSAPPYPQYYV